jgi:hypothetical protein
VPISGKRRRKGAAIGIRRRGDGGEAHIAFCDGVEAIVDAARR